MLTQEQQKVVDTILSSESDNKIVAVNSVAGSGKTSTALAVVEALKPNKGFYTAFNRAIIAEGKNKFPSNIECKTLHSLAYKYVKIFKPIKELTYYSIEEKISYDDKLIIIQFIGDFFRSKYLTLEDYINNSFNDIEHNQYTDLFMLINKYINLMEQGRINPTFDYILKSLHIMLHYNEIELNYDLVILDECQDVIPVTLEIFKLINSKKKLMLGDTNQNIYSFLNTVNGFDLLKDTINLKLTQSFRCTEQIAEKVENFGKRFLSSDFEYKGNPALVIDSSNKSKAYIAKTNATVIERMHYMHTTKQKYTLTRPIKELFSLPVAIYNASKGNIVQDKKYKFLESEYIKFIKKDYPNHHLYNNFFEYLLETFKSDSQIENTIKVLLSLKNKRINIFDVMNKAKKIKPDPSKILTTAHAFKGLEADIVHIEDNLNRIIAEIITKDELNDVDKENLNLYYVAITRARDELLNAAWCI